MFETTGSVPSALVLRMSVPAAGSLRSIATEVASKVAEYLGTAAQDAESVGIALEGLVGRVAESGCQSDITLEFRQVEGELLIRAFCEEHHSELRYPLPA